jgi:phage terminase large subunit-like protein
MSPAPEPSSSQHSLAEKFRSLPADERRSRIAQLSEEEAEALFHDWEFWARPNQKLPSGDWGVWFVKAGRGFGKTRIGAETVRIWVKDNAIVNLVGPTASDARDVMVEGPSGILSVCCKHERPRYEPSKRRLEWPNGARSSIYSADEPERLRGPQHMKLWMDEIAAWKRQQEAWDQAMFGLRLGSNPQACLTSTPKPTKLIREICKDPRTIVTSGSTYENRANLAKQFFKHIITKYEGTRLGRQELNAELLDDNPGALWRLAAIDADRVRLMPPLQRIVIGVDPAVTAKKESALTGIVAAGIGCAPNGQEWPPHFYVFDDLSLQGSPDHWAEVVVSAYKAHKADRIIAEVNNGGDLVEAILRTKSLEFAYKSVHASRGKLTRAEPIAALYEQHRVHHVGAFGDLEDQMCDFNPLTAEESPDRMDALVWALWALSEGEEQEALITHEEEVQIDSDLDEFDYRSSFL